jgi:hypothetical protein
VADPAGDQLQEVWNAEWEQHVMRLALERVKSQVGIKQFQMFDLHVRNRLSVADTAHAVGSTKAAVYMAKCRVGRLVRRESEIDNLISSSNRVRVFMFLGGCAVPEAFDAQPFGAAAMMRVTRPGGRIIAGTWIPNDPPLVAQILKIALPTPRHRRSQIRDCAQQPRIPHPCGPRWLVSRSSSRRHWLGFRVIGWGWLDTLEFHQRRQSTATVNCAHHRWPSGFHFLLIVRPP